MFIEKSSACPLPRQAFLAKNRVYQAFTLAEVLVTLGIIGVVAALSITTLVQNYKKQVLVNQLKKAMSEISQGLKLMMAEDDVTSLTQINGAMSYCGGFNKFETDYHCTPLGKRFLNTFKGSRYITNVQDIPDYKWKYLNGEKYEVQGIVSAHILSDNVMLLWGEDWLGEVQMTEGGHPLSREDIKYVMLMTIDVNGFKGPNQWGRDLYYFCVTPEGNLIPEGSEEFRNRRNGRLWNEARLGSCNPEKNKNSNGRGCSARIIDKGWKMDY